MKKTLTICCALLLLISLCAGALADGEVSYEGGAEKFVFLPGSVYSDSDLFENFKNVLPGDVLTQEIDVRNDTAGQVRIYMRAEPVSEADRAFLGQLRLTVEARSGEIFDAAASETAQLTENTLLGTFKAQGETELLVTLTVPADLGNEFMGKVGIVPWTFMVEEIPEDDTPHTGDWFELGAWIGAAALLIAAIAVLLILSRRRRTQN